MSDTETEAKPAPESQKFLTEFIDIYQAYPCLWKYSCKDYRNREVKELAYEALVDKMREIDPRADKNSVMRKINALRTAFRREYKKMRRANLQFRAAGARFQKKKYVTSLWYYDLLKFVVDDQDYSEPGPGTLITEWPAVQPAVYSSVEEDGKIVNHNAETLMEYLEEDTHWMVKLEPSSPGSSRPTTPAIQAPALNLEIKSVYSEKTGNASSTSNPRRNEEPMTSYRTRRTQQQQQQQQQQPQQQQQQQTSNTEPEKSVPSTTIPVRRPHQEPQQLPPVVPNTPTDHFKSYGSYVAAKLRKSSEKQCVIAEKVIAEVLMRANLGTLDETTTLTDPKVPRNHSN